MLTKDTQVVLIIKSVIGRNWKVCIHHSWKLVILMNYMASRLQLQHHWRAGINGCACLGNLLMACGNHRSTYPAWFWGMCRVDINNGPSDSSKDPCILHNVYAFYPKVTLASLKYFSVLSSWWFFVQCLDQLEGVSYLSRSLILHTFSNWSVNEGLNCYY